MVTVTSAKTVPGRAAEPDSAAAATGTASGPVTEGAAVGVRVKALREAMSLSLRDLDRALWARSWEKDLQELIADNPAEEKPVEEGIPTTEPKPWLL